MKVTSIDNNRNNKSLMIKTKRIQNNNNNNNKMYFIIKDYYHYKLLDYLKIYENQNLKKRMKINIMNFRNNYK